MQPSQITGGVTASWISTFDHSTLGLGSAAEKSHSTNDGTQPLIESRYRFGPTCRTPPLDQAGASMGPEHSQFQTCLPSASFSIFHCRLPWISRQSSPRNFIGNPLPVTSPGPRLP